MANAVDAQTLFAMKNGINAGGEMASIFRQAAMAQMRSSAIGMQMDEIADRSKYALTNIERQAEKAIAAQTAAFVNAGVSMEGSAMSVVSDTLNTAAQAAYIKQREADYELATLGMEKAALDAASSRSAMIMQITAAGIRGAAGYYGDMAQYNRTGVG